MSLGPSLGSAPEAVSQWSTDCSPRTDAPTPRETTQAAALADSIWSSPDQARCLLSMHSMTTGDLEELMAGIAADPELSEDYAKARKLGRRL